MIVPNSRRQRLLGPRFRGDDSGWAERIITSIPGHSVSVVRAALLVAGLLTLALPNSSAQQSGRQITIIVPYSPGTGIDILARALGNELSQKWGQPVVVDNKTGASGNIGTGLAARAAPDGNTLLMIAKVFVVNPSVFKSVPYDPITSFAPVIKLATGSIVLAVHPSVPADTAKGFIEYAKARPGQINYGSPGFATPHHLAMELFKQATGTDLVHVPYKGTSNVMSDLVGNHVGAMFIPTHVALPHAVRVRGRSLVRPARARRHAGRHRQSLQRRAQRVLALAQDGVGARQAGADCVRRHARRLA
jgi:tripartite-type tricarboxylate transporter receptor subunit TctC